MQANIYKCIDINIKIFLHRSVQIQFYILTMRYTVTYLSAADEIYLKKELLGVFQVLRCEQLSWAAECLCAENAEYAG